MNINNLRTIWAKTATIKHFRLILIFSVLFLIIFVPMSLIEYQNIKDETYNLDLLQSSGIEVQATVVDQEIREYKRKDSDDRERITYSYYIVYQFLDPNGSVELNGTSYKHKENVSKTFFESLSIGDIILIVFNSENPEMSKIIGEEDRALNSLKSSLNFSIFMVSIGMLGVIYCGWKLFGMFPHETVDIKYRNRWLLVKEATLPMLIALTITFLVMGVFAYYIMWPIGIILLVACFISVYLYWMYSRALKSIKKEPVVTDATIISVKKIGEFRFGERGTGPKTYRFSVVFEFTPYTSDGIKETLKLQFNYDDGNPDSFYKIGDVIPVLYARTDPRFAELKSEGIHWHDYWPK